MNDSKDFVSSVPSRTFSVRPKLFVFFDKYSGTPRFEVQAGDDGRLPVDQAVSLLAIHCVARQKMPRDFGVMVEAEEDLVDGLEHRAMKIIQGWSRSKPSSPLSQRQSEVLDGITQNLSNKEIAAKLHISERTVKFHVSALLEKFDVRGRVDLMLEAAHILPHEAVHKRPHNLPRFIFPVAASTPLAGNGGPTSPAVLVKSAAR